MGSSKHGWLVLRETSTAEMTVTRHERQRGCSQSESKKVGGVPRMTH